MVVVFLRPASAGAQAAAVPGAGSPRPVSCCICPLKDGPRLCPFLPPAVTVSLCPGVQAGRQWVYPR